MQRDNEGFPRLPFTKTSPTQADVDAILARARRDMLSQEDTLRRVLGIFTTYAGLQRRNDDFAARFWGTTDVSENTIETWNYVRNSDFLQGTNGNFKWANNAALTRNIVTTGLPYGVARGGSIQDTCAAKNWVQQSASAVGATWYIGGGWCALVAGASAGFDIVENSGSSTARTHSRYSGRTGIEQKLQIPFKTYKGTTRLTFRCVVASLGTAIFSQIQLEKGRRLHAWRKHILDLGYITTLKTAGSASYGGNIYLSGSGGARVRQVLGPPKKFVIGAPNALTAATTVTPVSATGAVGASDNYARQDHVHAGVRTIYKTANASADGRVGVVGSGGATVQILAGDLRIHATSTVTAGSGIMPVSSSNYAGVWVAVARGDHVHRGVKSIFKAANASADGRVGVVGSGGATVQILGNNLRIHAAAAAGTTTSLKTANSASWTGNIKLSASGGAAIRQVATKTFIFGAPKAASATPTNVSTSGTVGVSALYARSDHRHRGVKAIKYGGVSNSATISFSGSGTAASMGLAWSGKKLKVGFPKAATATPAKPSTSGTVGTGTLWARTDHRHRGVLSLRTAGSASFTAAVMFSASGGATIRQKTGPKKFIIGAPAAAVASETTPHAVSSAGYVGVGTTYARADHVHRGVTTLFKTGNASADGRVGVVASGGATVQILSSNLRIHAPAAGALDINGLTAADLALSDELPEYNAAAAANRKITATKIGGFLAIGVSELRLTLTSGTPVTTADVTAAGTIYLTPYIGNRIRLWDGTRWNERQTAEVSLALTATSGKPYDVFAYDNAGTVTLEILVWTNDTTRATALTTQNGVYVKNGDATRLYVGSFYASAANKTDDSAALRYLWNMYNRRPRFFKVVDTTDSWNYNGAFRQAGASAANQVSIMRGLDDDAVVAEVKSLTYITPSGYLAVGIGISSTSVDSSQTHGAASVAVHASHTAHYRGFPGVGRYYLAWLETAGAATATWYGDNGLSYLQSGMTGEVWA